MYKEKKKSRERLGSRLFHLSVFLTSLDIALEPFILGTFDGTAAEKLPILLGGERGPVVGGHTEQFG